MAQVSYAQMNWRAAGTTTERISLHGTVACGFFLPATVVGTAISFLVCDTVDGTYVALKNSGDTTISFTVTAGAASYHAFTQDQIASFMGVRHLQMVSNGTEPAAQIARLAHREIA